MARSTTPCIPSGSRLPWSRWSWLRASQLGVLVMVLLWPSLLRADPLLALGEYEREAALGVLERRALEVDPTPTGKRIERIIIVNLEVFGHDTGRLQALNALHRTTRNGTIRRELLAQPGDLWSETLVRETERVLRNPSLSSFVMALPVTSEADGTVDMLLLTRDVWSLRSNSSVVHQDGSISSLTVAAAENNLLGRRKHLSLILEMDRGEYSLSPQWRDLNVLGKRWQLTLRPRLLFARNTNKFEGTQSTTRLVYPLWSLATQWGFFLEATHKNAVSRTFEGNTLATYDDPETAEIERVRQEFRQRQVAIRSRVSRSFGRNFKHNFSVGYELLTTRSRFLGDIHMAPEVADSFARDLFPRNEQSSALTLGFDFFANRYVTFRNLNGYDLPEVKVAGPRIEAEAAFALRVLGSDRSFARNSVRASYLLDIKAGALLELGLTLRRRFQGGRGVAVDSVDSTYGADWFIASPVLGSVRLVSFGEASLRSDVRDNELVRLGGHDDLRGYKVGRFIGTSLYHASIELRSLPQKLAFARVGYVAFWDGGDAAHSIGSLGLHQNFGLGLKALIPQTGESLMFLYWAIPLDRDVRKFPGRISFGYGRPL